MTKYYNQAIQKTMQILAIDSVKSTPCESSPFGKGVGECIDLYLDWAKQLGMTTHNEQGYYGTAEYGQGEEFGILGHIDVVPYDNDWHANPLGEIKDNKIFGRGILDNKGPMVCCLVAYGQLLEEGYVPQRKVRFIVGGDEESGWKCMERFAQVDKIPREGFSPDGDFPVINCEKGLVHYEIIMSMPNNLVSIKGGSRGNIVMPSCKAVVDKPILSANYDNNLKIVVEKNKTIIESQGKPAHASTPQKGKNALWSCLAYLSKELGGEYTILNNLLSHNDGKPIQLDLSDEKSGKLTFNCGLIDTIKKDGQDFIKLVVDIRHPVSYDKEEIRKILEEKLPCQQVKIIHYHNPHYVDPNTPLVQELLGAYEQITNTKSKPIAIGGGTYARVLECGVAFGPMFEGQESTIHQKDENCDLDLFKKMYDIYYLAIKKLLFFNK